MSNVMSAAQTLGLVFNVIRG